MTRDCGRVGPGLLEVVGGCGGGGGGGCCCCCLESRDPWGIRLIAPSRPRPFCKGPVRTSGCKQMQADASRARFGYHSVAAIL